MYVLRIFIIEAQLKATCQDLHLQISELDFFLSVLVVVLLTAGGNIINDYFDVKVDKINKPERVIIGKTVKRRVAMALHQSFNITAVAISFYLCWKYKFWLPLAIPILVATLLWWYSPIFKKMSFVGNMVVAICVSIVPIWAAIFELHEQVVLNHLDLFQNGRINGMLLWILTYAGFAFLISLSREAIKDLEDLQGDKEGEYKTMPIIQGETFTKHYASLLMALTVGLTIFLFYKTGLDWKTDTTASALLFLCTILPGLITIIFSSFSRRKKHYTIASASAKLTMAGGLVLCILAGTYIWVCS